MLKKLFSGEMALPAAFLFMTVAYCTAETKESEPDIDPVESDQAVLCRNLVERMRAAAVDVNLASYEALVRSNFLDETTFLYRWTKYHAYEADRVSVAALYDADLHERTHCFYGPEFILRSIRMIQRTAFDAREASEMKH